MGWESSLFESPLEHVRGVRTSGRRDNLPVFPKAVGNKGEPGSVPRPVALRYSSRRSSNLWCTGSSFSLTEVFRPMWPVPVALLLVDGFYAFKADLMLPQITKITLLE